MTDEKEFMECNACAMKSGHPRLCNSCSHNDDLINDLKSMIKQSNVKNAIQGRDRLWCLSLIYTLDMPDLNRVLQNMIGRVQRSETPSELVTRGN